MKKNFAHLRNDWSLNFESFRKLLGKINQLWNVCSRAVKIVALNFELKLWMSRAFIRFKTLLNHSNPLSSPAIWMNESPTSRPQKYSVKSIKLSGRHRWIYFTENETNNNSNVYFLSLSIFTAANEKKKKY